MTTFVRVAWWSMAMLVVCCSLGILLLAVTGVMYYTALQCWLLGLAIPPCHRVARWLVASADRVWRPWVKLCARFDERMYPQGSQTISPASREQIAGGEMLSGEG